MHQKEPAGLSGGDLNPRWTSIRVLHQPAQGFVAARRRDCILQGPAAPAMRSKREPATPQPMFAGQAIDFPLRGLATPRACEGDKHGSARRVERRRSTSGRRPSPSIPAPTGADSYALESAGRHSPAEVHSAARRIVASACPLRTMCHNKIPHINAQRVNTECPPGRVMFPHGS